jgi:hypothetical protein
MAMRTVLVPAVGVQVHQPDFTRIKARRTVPRLSTQGQYGATKKHVTETQLTSFATPAYHKSGSFFTGQI